MTSRYLLVLEALKGQLKAGASARSIEQRKYNSKPEQKKNRAARNKARREAEQLGRVKKNDGKDVGHKNNLKSGGSTDIKNTRVQTVSSNRTEGGQIGDKKGKAKGGRHKF
jgi:hypothetical protein